MKAPSLNPAALLGRIALVSIAIGFALGGMPATDGSFALAENDYPDYGRVYLTLDPESVSQNLDVGPRTPFTFYLMLEPGEVPGVEVPYRLGALGGQILSSPELFISSIDWIGDSAYDFGEGLSPGVLDFAVGVAGSSEVPVIQQKATVVGRFEALFIEEVKDVRIEVGPQYGGEGIYDHFAYALRATPDYPTFEAPFDHASGSLKVNFTLVEAEPSSWGAVKALFQN